MFLILAGELARISHRAWQETTISGSAVAAVHTSIGETTMAFKLVKSESRSTGETQTGWATARALELATTLQTTLELDQLVKLFASEVHKQVAYDGLSYRNRELELEFPVGEAGRHQCTYQLSIAGHGLGELEFSRGRKFTEQDSLKLEYLLSALLYPLRNALMYRQALARALQDPLTGVNNRSGFDNSLRREVNLAHRHHTPLALLVADIDQFKSINDRFGHLIGDCVLRDVAACAASCVRNTDMLFRYGGEEFVVLLSNTGPDGAELLAERIRSTIQELCCTYGDTSLGVTVSLGVACLRDDESGNELFDRADSALYQAKGNGRNQVVVAD
jgi:diguanylate cyclase (GGDEF)-like protein